VSYVVPSTAPERGTVPDNMLTRAVQNNYNPARSGNILVVLNQTGLSTIWIDYLQRSSMGSSWWYDTSGSKVSGGS
jgi:glucan phosphoethanolaminetransferase (alkaline phosphatase superfamily)